MAYFRQHGCNTKEAHAKYNSRAASLYREKLAGMAAAAQKKYNTEVSECLSVPMTILLYCASYHSLLVIYHHGDPLPMLRRSVTMVVTLYQIMVIVIYPIM